MSEYIECQNCGFVLLSDSSSEPAPRRRDSCPDCGEADFQFTDE